MRTERETPILYPARTTELDSTGDFLPVRCKQLFDARGGRGSKRDARAALLPPVDFLDSSWRCLSRSKTIRIGMRERRRRRRLVPTLDVPAKRREA